MRVSVITGADSIFDVDLLVLLSHDATSAAENEAAPISYELLGLEKLCFQKWNWHAKVRLETKFQVSLTIIMPIMVVFPFCL